MSARTVVSDFDVGGPDICPGRPTGHSRPSSEELIEGLFLGRLISRYLWLSYFHGQAERGYDPENRLDFGRAVALLEPDKPAARHPGELGQVSLSETSGPAHLPQDKADPAWFVDLVLAHNVTVRRLSNNVDVL